MERSAGAPARAFASTPEDAEERSWRASAFSKLRSRSSGAMVFSFLRTRVGWVLACGLHRPEVHGSGLPAEGLVRLRRSRSFSRSNGASAEAYSKQRDIWASLRPRSAAKPLAAGQPF